MGLFSKIKQNKNTMPEERRRKNNAFIKKMGIACFEDLPVCESSSDVRLKDLDAICKRAVACLLSIQLACDIGQNEEYDKSRKTFFNLLKEFHVENELLEKEKRLFDKTYTNQDVMDIGWSYETYWALVWALGLIDDIKLPDTICDCKKAVTLVGDCKNYEEFKNNCKLRNIEDILDMLDLYYRYHWVCEEKRINPDTNIGKLNPEVVVERRRGLEWLVSGENDWNEISLDT